MINKASELLEHFIEAEKQKLAGVKMPHMPTLGSAYEEITKQGIDQHFVIPKQLNLKVVSGFIEFGGKMLPEQIDCMLVCGEGKQYGITKQYIYDIENVLCVFEVKKTLSKKDFSDAINHLGKIKKAFAEQFEHKLKNEAYDPDVAVIGHRFSQLTGKSAPTNYRGIHELPENEGILFYTLVQEFFAPVTIIHGYSGYATESGIRNALLDIIQEKKIKDSIGVGIPTIPSLVISGNYSLIKGNGLPFLGVCQGNKWAAVLSTRYNSAKLILELIWTKISVRFNIKMPYDDGLYMDNLEPLLVAEAIREGDVAGWMYNCIESSEKFLQRNDDRLWSPVTIGIPEVTAINLMACKGGYLPLDKDLDEYFMSKYKKSIEELKGSLISTKLFMILDEYIRPIYNQVYLITCDDGSGFVSSERERFDIWCEENNIAPHYFILLFME